MRRLERLLRALSPRAPGLAVANITQILWPTCGGPRQEIEVLVDVLVRSGLAQTQALRIYRTRQGERITSMEQNRSRQELALVLIRRGWLHDQVQRLLPVLVQERTDLACSLEIATHKAAQLVSLLRAWPDIVTDTEVRISGMLLAELDSPWSLIPATGPSSKDPRLAVGKRGEAYSYQYLRHHSSDHTTVLWVAADDETLGYDLEEINEINSMRIEVKASRGKPVRFILTPNEHRKAHEYGPDYMIHFWGEINLHLDPAHEYQQLLDRGYPLVFQDLPNHLRFGTLRAEPSEWLITQP